jgi:hypothetical protein
MSPVKSIPVFGVWIVCAFNITLTGMLILQMALHPAGRVENPLLLWGVYSLPHLILAAVAWVSRGSPTLVWILLATVCVITVPGSLARFRATEESVRYADYRAQGKKLMNCGPPMLQIAVALEQLAVWGITLAGLLAAIVLKCVEAHMKNQPQEEPYTGYDDPDDDESDLRLNFPNDTFGTEGRRGWGRDTDITRRKDHRY